MTWDPIAWLVDFREAASRRDGDRLHALRRAVFLDTVEIVKARRYEAHGGEVDLDPAGAFDALHAGTTFHADTDELAVPDHRRGRFRTRVTVHNADFLEIARAVAVHGETPAVLNMANRHNPGGGVQFGAGAQEENLFRRSNLLHGLYQFAPYAADYDVPPSPEGRAYPIPKVSGGIFSPQVRVFRSSEQTGYALLPRPYPVHVVTVPAINAPAVRRVQGRVRLTDAMADATRVKIRAILRIAAHHDVEALVLSAFGCGAFLNPPEHVAELFAEVLGEAELEGVFRHVAFAVLDDHNAFRPESPRGNYLPFEEALSPLR